jgi:hypothetical protein
MFYGIAYSMYNVTTWVQNQTSKLFNRIVENGNYKRFTEEGDFRITE